MTSSLRFNFSTYDYVIDSATCTIQSLPKEEKKGKAKLALEQLSKIYFAAKDSPELSRQLSEAKIEQLQHFASSLALYIQNANPYGVLQWLISKSQSQFGYGLAGDLCKISKSLEELRSKTCLTAYVDEERQQAQRQRIDEHWARIDKTAPDYESLNQLNKLLKEAEEQKNQEWFRQIALFVAEATKSALFSTIKLVLSEKGFNYSIHKKAQELLPYCSLQEVLTLLKEPPLVSLPGQSILILGDIFSKTTKRDHDEKAYTDALEYFSDKLWFALSPYKIPNTQNQTGQDQTIFPSLRKLLATLFFHAQSLDWAQDFLVRNRRTNDTAIELLIKTLREIHCESLFPKDLQPAVLDLINTYNQHDLPRILMQAINKETLELGKIEALEKALSRKGVPRKILDQAVDFFSQYLIWHLNHPADNPQLKKHLRAVLGILANKSKTLDWLKKIVETIVEPAWIAPLVAILTTWNKKCPFYPQVIEQIKLLQLLETALPDLTFIEANAIGQIAFATLIRISDALQKVPPEIQNARPKCLLALQHTKESLISCIKKNEMQLLPALFERLFLHNFIDDLFLAFKRSEPDEASIICVHTALKAILATSTKKNEVMKMMLQLSVWLSLSDQMQQLQILSEAHVKEEKLHDFAAALLQFPEFFRDLPIFQRALDSFAECLIGYKVTHLEYYVHLLTLANPLTDMAKFTYLYAMTSENMAQVFLYEELLLKARSQIKLRYVEVIQLALFLASDCQGCASEALHIKRLAFAIPRSLVIDRVAKRHYILLKSKNPQLQASGTFKKVTSALALSPQSTERSSIVAQAVLKTALDNDTLPDFLHEEALLKELSGCPGIWPLLFSCQYLRYKKEKKEPQGSFFLPLADGDLHEPKFSIIEQLHIAFMLSHGLQAMHEKMIIHGDLKERNALYLRKPDTSLEIGWIDLGTAKRVDTSDTAHFRMGYYGSIFYTPPELFGEKNFTGNPFKVEVWALGYVLYKLYYHRYPSWSTLLLEYYDDQCYHSVTLRAKKRMKQHIHTVIEEPYACLIKEQNDRPLTTDEQYRLLIYQMLRYDPASRIELPKAIELLQMLNPVELPPTCNSQSQSV